MVARVEVMEEAKVVGVEMEEEVAETGEDLGREVVARGGKEEATAEDSEVDLGEVEMEEEATAGDSGVERGRRGWRRWW